MENKLTAVEWLMNQITFEEDDENNPEGKGRFASFQDYVNLKEYFDKAIAMEKEQIREAYYKGVRDEWEGAGRDFEDFYNETYGDAND